MNKSLNDNASFTNTVSIDVIGTWECVCDKHADVTSGAREFVIVSLEVHNFSKVNYILEPM